MPSPFDFWDIKDAQVAVQLPTERANKLVEYRDFAEGRHFRDWDGWTGPIPVPDDPDYVNIRAEIERGFVSRGVIGEVITRHVNGCLGRDVRFSLVPRRILADGEAATPDEQARIDEAQGWLTTWVDERKLNQEYDTVCKTLGYAGLAYQRPFIAPGALDENGALPAADIATNLGRIYVHFPQPGEAVLYTDPRTQSQCSIYLYREIVSDRPSQAQGKPGAERAELTYLDGENTVIRILGDKVDDTQDFAYALSRRLLMSSMARPALINESVVSQQKLLNKTLSMKSINMDLAGFRERVTINARMGGSYQTNSAGVEEFVANVLPVGPSALTNLTGYKLKDADGNETLATPQFQWLDPVPVQTFIDTERSAYLAILAECNQLHYAVSADAGISAESRQTAMAAYLIDLLQTKQQIDQGWAWLLETVLALAATVSNQAGRYDDLRVSAEASVDPGPINESMIQTTMTLWQNGMLSLDTALGWVGIDDSTAEIAKIQLEQAADAERRATMATAMLEAAGTRFDRGQNEVVPQMAGAGV